MDEKWGHPHDLGNLHIIALNMDENDPSLPKWRLSQGLVNNWENDLCMGN